MPPTDSDLAQLLVQLKLGDSVAERRMFDLYVTRLVAYAKLNIASSMRQRFDEDDVVQSVFRIFFSNAKAGVIVLQPGGDLWSLLALLTLRKVQSKAQFHRAAKRDIFRQQGTGEDNGVIESTALEEPMPDEVIIMKDELEFVLRQLTHAQRKFVELRLEGLSMQQIADKCSASRHRVKVALDRFCFLLTDRFQE